MQVTEILIVYQSNYNGCTVILNDEFDEFDVSDNKELEAKLIALQDAVVEKAYEDVIKSGRHEGEFNGDVDDLEDFAFKKAIEIFGEGIALKFEEDDSST